MGVKLTHTEVFEQSNALVAEAKTLAENPEATGEDIAKSMELLEEAKGLRDRSKALSELNQMASDAVPHGPGIATGPEANQHQDPQTKFRTFGEFLTSVWKVAQYNQWDDRLKQMQVTMDDDPTPAFNLKQKGWIEQLPAAELKTMAESAGATGGFGVAPEYRMNLMMLSEFSKYVRERALVLPMTARQVYIPALDQTGSTAGTTNLYGGVVPSWTEETAEKSDTEPSLRQLMIQAHKLALYTEASDELLADSALPLETLLYQLFGSAIANEEEWTFINGTGAGQPLGINHAACGATYRQTRVTANQISITDVFNILSHFMGSSPIWLAHQSTMPQILALNGPSTNPSYVWIGNARDGAPTTLMGYPIFFIENTVTLGSEGDLILADWSKYVIGDRQATTIDSSKHFKFRNDLTSWRAVHRVGGRPWLSAVLTLRDGSTQVSPFVILDDGVTPT